MRRFFGASLLLLALLMPYGTHAQDQDADNPASHEYLEEARVSSTTPLGAETEPWSGAQMQNQLVAVEVLQGPDKGTTATFTNNYTQVRSGDLVYVRHTVGGFGPDMWSISDPYRLNVLAWVAVGFLILLLVFGGLQGIRALASLIGSLVLIFYLLIPAIYNGHSPILVSIGVASLIIIVGSYITHGFNRTTTIAMASMVLTVAVVGGIAYFVIRAAQLSGYTTEEAAYLSLDLNGNIDLIGLLFGGIMIGLLRVLYDIAIGQAIAVEELIAAAAHYTRKQVFGRAMRIGREHIGALVNTLAIAYVGAALPLLLLFRQTEDVSVLYLINSERFATEIIRILMGSSGLVLAVPITTLIATYFLYGRSSAASAERHAH